MRHTPIIALDVDEVTLQLIPVWLRKLDERTGCGQIEISKHRSWRVEECIDKKYHDALYEILNTSDLYDTVEPMPDALYGVDILRHLGYRVVFVTSSANGHAGAKLRWLVRYGFLPEVKFAKDYVECYDKTLITADLLIDDRPTSCLQFEAINGPRSSILFMPRELDIEYRPGLQYVRNWRELINSAPLLLPPLHR